MKLNSGSILIEVMISMLIMFILVKVVFEIVNLTKLEYKIENKYEERI